MATRVIDTHIHAWNLERAEYGWLKNDTTILNQSYSVEQLSPLISKANVTQGILVQAANNFDDTDLMLEIAAKTDWIVGVVGWLPLTDPEAVVKALEEKYLYNSYFRGCRHLIHNESNARWLLQDNVMESLKVLAAHGIPYDIVGVSAEHLETAIQVAGRIPGLKMVLDHLNQPPIASKEKFGRWGELMKEFTQYKNVHAKISGLGTTVGIGNNWTKDDLQPYVVHTLELFGADRCFCGGDWPVALLAGPYEKALLAYQQILMEGLTTEDQEKVLFKNAVLFYNLSFII